MSRQYKSNFRELLHSSRLEREVLSILHGTKQELTKRKLTKQELDNESDDKTCRPARSCLFSGQPRGPEQYRRTPSQNHRARWPRSKATVELSSDAIQFHRSFSADVRPRHRPQSSLRPLSPQGAERRFSAVRRLRRNPFRAAHRISRQTQHCRSQHRRQGHCRRHTARSRPRRLHQPHRSASKSRTVPHRFPAAPCRISSTRSPAGSTKATPSSTPAAPNIKPKSSSTAFPSRTIAPPASAPKSKPTTSTRSPSTPPAFPPNTAARWAA